jgi:ligand-binding sensor domain-containing protein
VDNQSNLPRSRRAAAVLGVIAFLCPRAIALNPILEVSQYAHTAWMAREVFFNGAINAIGQDRGGYLLLATELGLLRFDGVRPTALTLDRQIARGDIRTVFAASDGRIWIGLALGLSSLKDGQLTEYPELTGQRVLSILEDSQGTIWVGGYAIPRGRLCAFRDGKADCAGMAGEFARGITSLYQSPARELWVGAPNGLWRWRPNLPKRYSTPGASSGIRALAKGGGSFLIATQHGIRQLLGEEVRPYPPLANYEFPALCVLEDREGGLWVGTGGQGLLHLHQGRVDRFTRPDGLSGDTVNSVFEDREGSIWVGTNGGLDRFREFAVPSISIKQGLSNAAVNSVMAARDGSIWLGTQNGLDRWKDREMTVYKRSGRSPVNAEASARVILDDGLPDDNAQATFEDSQGRIWVCSPHGVAYFESGRLNRVSTEPDGFVSSIAGDRSGNLWVSDEYNGLIHYSGTRKIEQVPWAKLRRSDYASAMVAVGPENGVWLGFRNGGVGYFKDGRLRE